MSKVTVLVANEQGEIYDVPGLVAVGAQGNEIKELKPEDLVPLPESADLMYLPHRQALAITDEGEIIPITEQVVAAILPAGYTRLYLPAYQVATGIEPLPLYGYTAVALYEGEIYAAASLTDSAAAWNPLNYNTRNLRKLINKTKRTLPNNPIIEQLAKCSLEWHCLTAQNMFYHRDEAGLPVSPNCNARCLGCISLQKSGCCPSPQQRITFRPTVEEITEVMLYHLSTAPKAIISFGQGCEGDPSLEADAIAESIRRVRRQTERGQININTNGGFYGGIKKIVAAGLDSMRVSIISPLENSYATYYRAGYKLSAVKDSIRYALDNNVHVSLNLLTMPGFNDREEEIDAWRGFLRELPIQAVQIRNLNLDPEYFFAVMPKAQGKCQGIRKFMSALQEAAPGISLGSFSHYIK